MMSDLLQKLHVLIRAGLHDLIGGDATDRGSIRRVLTSRRIGQNFDEEIKALRSRINDAIAYEDQLTAQAATLREEVESLDRQADTAVSEGAEDRARLLVAQMQRAQQRLAMAEADLREHRFLTQDLIQRVNTLEAIVSEARAAEESDATDRSADPGEQPRDLAGVLRQIRQQLDAELSSSPGVSTEHASTPTDSRDVEADLERRRSRLSKPQS